MVYFLCGTCLIIEFLQDRTHVIFSKKQKLVKHREAILSLRVFFHFPLGKSFLSDMHQDPEQFVILIYERLYNKADLPAFAGLCDNCDIKLMDYCKMLADNFRDRIFQLLVRLVIDEHHDLSPVSCPDRSPEDQ